MSRRLQRVGDRVVIGMAEKIRHVEDKIGQYEQEDHNPEGVLDGRVRREVHHIGWQLDINADRIVLADDVKRPDVQSHDAGKHEWQQVVQGEEAIEGRVVDREIRPITVAVSSGLPPESR